jgi:hypothetical protein
MSPESQKFPLRYIPPVFCESHQYEPPPVFKDREPAGPYQVIVPANRTNHLLFNDLTDPEPIPRGTDYASVIESDVPIVVQHTRLDSRQDANALLTTIAYAGVE